jgi:transposase-like protein
MKVTSQWCYLHRAVDKAGHTIDSLLTAQRFLTQAIRYHGVPETITIDGSEANASAIRGYNDEHGRPIIIHQVKYRNNLVEQDHRGVNRLTRPMLGLKCLVCVTQLKLQRKASYAERTAPIPLSESSALGWCTVTLRGRPGGHSHFDRHAA